MSSWSGLLPRISYNNLVKVVSTNGSCCVSRARFFSVLGSNLCTPRGISAKDPFARSKARIIFTPAFSTTRVDLPTLPSSVIRLSRFHLEFHKFLLLPHYLLIV